MEKTPSEALRKRDDYVRMQERGYNMYLIDTSFAEYGETWLDTYRTECNPMQRRQDVYKRQGGTSASPFLHLEKMVLATFPR